MPYATQIIYNGIDPFFPQPTPLVGADYNNIYYTELWAKEEIFTLQGTLTGCNYSDITAAQLQILQNFTQNFQTLTIQETDNNVLNIIYNKNFVEIASIDFAQSLWRGVLPYTITIRSYPSGFFSGAYGILNPVDRWDYAEQQNLSLNATHTISCQGINVSSGFSDALDNARIWAYGRTGISNSVTPLFINNSNTGYFVQTVLEERIDRINGRYSLVERYINDLTRPGYGILRYNTDIISGHNLITVNLNGTIQGGNEDATDLRAVFSGFSALGAASNAYQETIFQNYGSQPDLNPYPLVQKITEDIDDSIISFNYVFDNDPSPQEIFDYDVNLISGNEIQVSIEGIIKVRGGDIYQKYTNAINYASTLNLYQLAVPFYNLFYPYSLGSTAGPAFSLNPIPVSSGMKVSLTDGTVSLFANFNNDVKVSPYLDWFHYTISVNCPVEKLDFKPIVGVIVPNTDPFSVVDLGYVNRSSFNINGQALIMEGYNVNNGLIEIKNVCFNLFVNKYGGPKLPSLTLDEENIKQDRYDERLVTFSFTWSFDGIGFGATNDLKTIDNLSLTQFMSQINTP